MKILILSDIHGNLSAMEAVIQKVMKINGIEGVVLLGDLIDYGLHSNEVIQLTEKLPYPILCNIRGNHEEAVVSPDQYARFSSERGRRCSAYTKSILQEQSWKYIHEVMQSSGICEFMIEDKKCLAVHGSIEDVYWRAISPEEDLNPYRVYDFVFSGHSHCPHFFERFYDADRPEFRNKKKTLFINPGSVGQPRNLNAQAQFAVFDTKTEAICFEKVAYDIKKEQAVYHGQVDDFYCSRLTNGI